MLTVKDSEFVEAARAVGASDGTILFQYILPNALAPILVQVSLGIGDSILAVAGLSYLGLGVQRPSLMGGNPHHCKDLYEGCMAYIRVSGTVLNPGCHSL